MEFIMAEADAAVHQYSQGTAQLKIDLQQIHYLTIGEIWSGIIEFEKQSGLNKISSDGNAIDRSPKTGDDEDNQVIWDEICDGRSNRKSRLTENSDDAAGCLVDCKVTDLFLNHIEKLTPRAARRLFKWKGKWVCLNGLAELPSDVASSLFQWAGDWISLNGLIYMNFDTSAYMLNWRGSILELMGLSPDLMKRDPATLRHLANWQRSGKKLFVSDRIRELIQLTDSS
jgi:hypothetical protein